MKKNAKQKTSRADEGAKKKTSRAKTAGGAGEVAKKKTARAKTADGAGEVAKKKMSRAKTAARNTREENAAAGEDENAHAGNAARAGVAFGDGDGEARARDSAFHADAAPGHGDAFGHADASRAGGASGHGSALGHGDAFGHHDTPGHGDAFGHADAPGHADALSAPPAPMEYAAAERGELSGEAHAEERGIEDTLRPASLAEMVGQNRLRENLAVFVEAAAQRGESLDHLLFYGPPGLGKTSLARIVAREMGVTFRATSGPVLERAGDLAALLSNLTRGDVLFIDEVHRLPAAVEEILYPAMEDFQIDVLVGSGPSARSIRLDLPRFTLVAATTRAGLLSSPLRDRFGWSARLDYYPPAELAQVLARSARLMEVPLATPAAEEIARRSRGTPRIANRLLRRVRDFAVVAGGAGAGGGGRGGDGDGAVDLELARYALSRLDVDEAGFDKLDRVLLGTLMEKFDGGPVGLDTLAAAIGEDRGTLEDLVEPFLLQGGYLDRTPRGRVATKRAYEHFGRA